MYEKDSKLLLLGCSKETYSSSLFNFFLGCGCNSYTVHFISKKVKMLKKYNFVPENQLNKEINEIGLSVTLGKNFNLVFGVDITRLYELDKKVIRLYADIEKKCIAWTEIKEGDISVLKNVRVLKELESGIVILMIRKVISNFGITKEMLPFKKIQVTTYKDQLLDKEFFVLDLKDYIDSYKSKELKHVNK